MPGWRGRVQGGLGKRGKPLPQIISFKPDTVSFKPQRVRLGFWPEPKLWEKSIEIAQLVTNRGGGYPLANNLVNVFSTLNVQLFYRRSMLFHPNVQRFQQQQKYTLQTWHLYDIPPFFGKAIIWGPKLFENIFWRAQWPLLTCLTVVEITEMTTMEEFSGKWMQTSAQLYDEFLKVRQKDKKTKR